MREQIMKILQITLEHRRVVCRVVASNKEMEKPCMMLEQ